MNSLDANNSRYNRSVSPVFSMECGAFEGTNPTSLALSHGTGNIEREEACVLARNIELPAQRVSGHKHRAVMVRVEWGFSAA